MGSHRINGYDLSRKLIQQCPNNNPSTATIRLLCHVMVAGGVIGHGGSVVRNMEARIGGVRIRMGGAIPGCVERVVNVTGSDVVSRKVRLGVDEDEEEVVCDVSPVQEALLRVFERAMEVDAENGDEAAAEEEEGGMSCCCRLLADRMECGILIGKGGKRVAKISRECRANIRVLRSEQNPACASPDDKVIHITGGLLSVKRALLAVSNVLQGLSQTENEPVLMNNFPAMITVPTMMNNAPVITVHRQELLDPHVEFFPDLCVPVHAARGVKEVGSVNISRSVGEGDEQCDVVFRMICSNYEAGAIIGKGATVVRVLQNESGAFINFAPPMDGVEYRMVTISAKEGLSSSYSPAQNAVVRIVARVAEIAAKESSGNKAETIVVRLVITPAQADSFRGEESTLSEIRDVEIQILEGDLKLSSHTTDEILQVTGEYRAVQIAILQITKKLRDGCFPSSVLKRAGKINHLSCAIPDIDTFKRTKNPNFPSVQKSLQNFPNFNQESMAWGMNDLRISNRSNGHLPRPKKDMGKGNMSKGDLESTKSSDKKVTLDVEVPDHAFDSVFGENGSNIDHIRQITAAEVKLQNPAPGQTQCTVTVSGEPTQVLAASTLLQAYIQAASLSSSGRSLPSTE